MQKSEIQPSKILIIGYGNTLRGDDGAGQKVAEIVANWNMNDIISLAVHQLTPELVDIIAQVELTIFIDVIPVINQETAKLAINPLKITLKTNQLGHHNTPENLLSLTQAIYGKVPPAYLILIPAINFEFGEEFSSMTKKFIDLALTEIKTIISSANFI